MIRSEHKLYLGLNDPSLSSFLIQNSLSGQLDKFNDLPNPDLRCLEVYKEKK